MLRHQKSGSLSIRRLFAAAVGPACEALERRTMLALLNDAFQLPQLFYDTTGTLAYNKTTQQLDVNATPLFIQYTTGGANRSFSAINTRSWVTHIKVDNSGNLIGGVSGDDFVITGNVDTNNDGVRDGFATVLTGEIAAFGYLNSSIASGGTDQYDFRLNPTGGTLLPYFTGKDIGVRMTSTNSNFSDSFAVNFSGGAQGTVAPVEIPPPPTPTGSIFGSVYEDTNDDGIRNGTDVGIDGVTVQLYNGATLVDTKITSGGGFYAFNSLPAGSYTIKETQPAGYLDGRESLSLTPLNNPVNDQIDVSLATGQQWGSFNFGELIPSSLSGYVYHDSNDDGSRAGESGINNVSVTLTGTDDLGNAVNQTTSTNASGAYSFTNLRPSNAAGYTISESQPAGYLDGIDTIGTPGGAAANDVFSAIVLGENVNGTENNFGELLPATIGDRVWRDLNANGIQDSGEPGIDGITVELLNASNNVIATTSTSGGGIYSFTNLFPGSYSVHFAVPAGYVITAPDQGSDDQADSDANASTGVSGSYTLVSGQTDNSLDAGILPIDLSLTKSVDKATPNVGDSVVFTITLTNASGFSTATGVVVSDLLPTGMSFVSATPSQGSYNNTTGLWSVGTVAAGTSKTLTLVATATSAARPSVTNTAEVTAADQPDTDSTPNNHSAAEDDQASVVVSPQLIDLSLTKTVSNAAPYVGQNVTFTITLSNAAGFNTATGVAVMDVLPSGLTYVSSSAAQGSFDSSTGVWTVGTLAAGASTTLTITATATAAARPDVTNVVQVTAADQPDVDSTPNNKVEGEDDQASATLAPVQIDLSLTKTVNNTTPNVGQNVTYTITLSNGTGFNIATGVVVTDVLPAGMSFVSAAASQGSYSSGSGAWSVGSVAGGSSVTLTIVATATAAAIPSVTNIAEVTAANEPDADSTPNNHNAAEDDQASIVVSPKHIDLSLTKAVDNSTPNVGSNVTYTITLSNAAGQSAATGVQVSDLLPAGMSFVSASTLAGSYNNATGVWNVGSLASGSSVTLTITATATAAARPSVTNTAEVTAANEYDVDSTPNNHNAAEDDQASVVVSPQQIDLSLTKTVDDATPNVGTNVTYTITLSNASGFNTATGVVVSDLLPAGMNFVSANPSQGSYNSTTGAWSVGTLAGGGSVTMTIVATATPAARPSVTNTAEVTVANQPDVDSTPNNQVATEDDQASVVVSPQQIDLSLLKTVNSTTPLVNTSVTYTITLSNASGYNTATGVTVADLLPTGVIYVSSSASLGSYDSTTGVWTVGTLAGGASATLSITATVTTTAPAAVTNTAEVTAAGQPDVDSTPNNHVSTEEDQSSVTIYPVQYASIGDFVWEDLNANGKQDTNEPGISGVTVNLLDSSGTVISTTTTNTNGNYSFINLVPGTYSVQFIKPTGFNFTLADQGSNDALDSDANQTTGKTGNYTLVGGQNNTTVDAGFVGMLHGLTGTIGFWANKNGQALINLFNGSSTSTKLGSWMATNWPNIYGSSAGTMNLSNKTNAQIASLYVTKFNTPNPPKLDAQLMALVFAIYTTTKELNNTSAGQSFAQQHGFILSNQSDTANNLRYKTWNLGVNGDAFATKNSSGAYVSADNTTVSVWDLLTRTNSFAVKGVLWANSLKIGTTTYTAATLQNQANVIFSAINQAGDILSWM